METLVIAINSVNAIANDVNVCTRMADVRYNTLCMLWMNAEASPADLALFRAIAAIRLSIPPPCKLFKNIFLCDALLEERWKERGKREETKVQFVQIPFCC